MSGSRKWTLWRQDDNGSSAMIVGGLSKEDAESRRSELEARGHKQYYWVEPEKIEMPTALNLVVLRSEDIEASRSFYELLGIQFKRHKHGAGAEHYASESSSTVFEIYPVVNLPSVGARVGFKVHSVDATIGLLTSRGYEILSVPKDSPWGRRAVARDPDGHSVELVTPPNDC